MNSHRRIYLDNAATSWPKPESVYRSVEDYMRNNGSGLGRTTGADATDLSGVVSRLREAIKQLVGSKKSAVLFTFNGTDSLNMAIHGCLESGDHVITSAAEHNSVLRPLRFLEDSGKIQVTRIPCDANGRVEPREVLEQVGPRTKLVALTHCSNVTGVINPVKEIGQNLADSQTLFLVDAAQSLGTHPIDFDDAQIDLLASPGHKGLYGPLGTGILAVSPKAQQILRPVRQGGTGASSESDVHPISYPEGFEAGNHNVPGLIGLNAGVEFLAEVGINRIAEHKAQLVHRFLEKVGQCSGIELVAEGQGASSGIVSFNLPLPATELAAILDSSFGIQIRAGYHCASLIHPYIGTSTGCARISFGYFNTEQDADQVADALIEISKAFA